VKTVRKLLLIKHLKISIFLNQGEMILLIGLFIEYLSGNNMKFSLTTSALGMIDGSQV
jgi:hypothetical protein